MEKKESYNKMKKKFFLSTENTTEMCHNTVVRIPRVFLGWRGGVVNLDFDNVVRLEQLDH